MGNKFNNSPLVRTVPLAAWGSAFQFLKHTTSSKIGYFSMGKMKVSVRKQLKALTPLNGGVLDGISRIEPPHAMLWHQMRMKKPLTYK